MKKSAPFNRSTSFVAALSLCVPLLIPSLSNAATSIWDSDTVTTGVQDGAGTWSPAGTTFWNGSTDIAITNDITTDIAQFGGAGTLAAQATVNVSTLSINGLIFGATTTSGYLLTNTGAATLTLGGSGITLNTGAQATTLGSVNLSLALGAAQSWTNNAASLLTVGGAVDNGGNLLTVAGSGNTTMSGIVSGAGGLTKSGAGTLTLTAADTFSGVATVNLGTLTLNGGAGTLANTTGLTVTGGGIFNLGDATAGNGLPNRINNAATLTLGGSTGAGTFTLVRGSTTANSQSLASLTVGAGGLSTINASAATGGAPALTFSGAAPYLRSSAGGVVNIDTTNLGVTFTNAPTGSAVAGTANPILVGAVLKGNDFIKAASGAVAAPTYDTAWGNDATLNVTGGNITATTNAVNALRFNDATARTLTLLGTGTTSIASGMILTTSGAAASQIITGGTLASGNGADLIIYDNHSTLDRRAAYGLKIASVISGGSVTVAGPTQVALFGQTNTSSVWFSGANTYSGGTFLDGAGLMISSDLSLGAIPGSPMTNITAVSGNSSLVNNTAGALTLNANRSIAINSGASLQILDASASAGQVITVNGAISGGGNLYVGRAGGAGVNDVTVLAGANTMTGNIAVVGYLRADEGVGLSSSANLALGDAGTDGGVLETKGSFTRAPGTGAGQVQIGAGSRDPRGAGFSAVGGSLTLNFGNDLRTMKWGDPTGIAGATQMLMLQDANATAALTWQNSIDLNGATRTVNVNNATFGATMSGVLSNSTGTGGLTKIGAGILVLSGNNTYNGQTQIQNGTLSVGSLNKVTGGSTGSNLGAPTTAGNGLILIGNAATAGTLLYTGAGETTDRTIQVGTNSATPAATDTGGATIQNDGSGALTFSAANFNTATNAATGVGANRVLTLQGSNTGANTIQGIVQDNAKSGSATGTTTVGLTKAGTGTWVLSGANTYTGVTTLTSGTLNLGVAETVGTSGPLGKSAAANAGSIVLNGGCLQYSAANQNDYSGRFSTAINQQYNVDTNSQAVAWGTALTSVGGSLAKTGAGTLTLSAADTYTGATAVSAGTLQIGNGGTAGAIGSTSGIAVASGATLGFNRTDSYGGNFTPVISGAGGLALSNGTLTLSSANTFSGDTVLNGGTLTTGIATALQNSTLNYNNQGGTLSFGTLTAATLGGLKGAQNFALLNTSGTGVNVSVGNNNAATTYTGIITGTNSAAMLTKVGTGTLTFDPGAAATSGTIYSVTVTGGTLALNSGVTTLTNNAVIGTGAALNLTGGSLISNAGYFTDNGTLNLSGGTLTANNPELLMSFNNSGGILNLSGSGVLNATQIRMGNGANARSFLSP
ncbi:MAG: autotransporter-associated beta strand repeat-containing protein [Verrucomicrobiota bacterium]